MYEVFQTAKGKVVSCNLSFESNTGELENINRRQLVNTPANIQGIFYYLFHKNC